MGEQANQEPLWNSAQPHNRPPSRKQQPTAHSTIGWRQQLMVWLSRAARQLFYILGEGLRRQLQALDHRQGREQMGGELPHRCACSDGQCGGLDVLAGLWRGRLDRMCVVKGRREEVGVDRGGTSMYQKN